MKLVLFGAAGRSRTDTVSLPSDFESDASANSTTAASLNDFIIIANEIKKSKRFHSLFYIFFNFFYFNF